MRDLAINQDKSLREKALDVLTNPKYAGLSVEKKADMLGVDRGTIYNWYKDEQFVKDLEQRSEELRKKGLSDAKSEYHHILKAMLKAAKNGNVQAAKFLRDEIYPDKADKPTKLILTTEDRDQLAESLKAMKEGEEAKDSIERSN